MILQLNYMFPDITFSDLTSQEINHYTRFVINKQDTTLAWLYTVDMANQTVHSRAES